MNSRPRDGGTLSGGAIERQRAFPRRNPAGDPPPVSTRGKIMQIAYVPKGGTWTVGPQRQTTDRSLRGVRTPLACEGHLHFSSHFLSFSPTARLPVPKWTAVSSKCRGPADTSPIFVRIRVSPQDAIDIKGVGRRKVHKQYGRGLNYRIRGASRGVAQGNVLSLNVSLFRAGVDSGSRKCIIPADVEIGHTTSLR